ncbi:MAG: glycosyltransferase family 1 protein, partial [Patescibacteria group bacterium]
KLLQIDKKNQYLLIFTYFRGDSRKKRLIESFRRPNTITKVLKIPGNLKEKIWTWRISWLNLFLGKTDVFYAPSFLEVNLGLKIPQVVTIYDMSTFLFPEHRGVKISEKLNLRTRLACQKAKKIIAISGSTKKDLQEILKIKENKIQMIYPGPTEFAQIASKLPNNLKAGNYLLSVGTIEPRKNLIGLFKAYALLPPNVQEKFPLVVVGAQGWQTGEIFTVFRALKLESKVKLLGFVPDAVLAKLYKEAKIFIYPSFYEGFGFPVLEALNFSTPVITSDTSSLPEVAEKAAILIDPKNPLELSSGMMRLLEHQNAREELVRFAKKQAQKFSWDKAARETLKVFEEILNK